MTDTIVDSVIRNQILLYFTLMTFSNCHKYWNEQFKKIFSKIFIKYFFCVSNTGILNQNVSENIYVLKWNTEKFVFNWNFFEICVISYTYNFVVDFYK